MNIRISYAEIEQAAAALAQGRDEITAKLQQLEQQMQQLASSGFVTEVASQRFAAAYQHYTAHAAGVIEQLQEIQGYLRQTAQSLQDADAQLAARLG